MTATPPRRSIVLVMHPDPLLRAGLGAALREQAAFEVLEDGVDSLPDSGPAIDVVIGDYAQALAHAAARAAHPRLADSRMLALTAHEREADIRRAIEAGVHGYLLVGGPISELIEGLAAVAGGARYLARSVAQRMADSLSYAALTAREAEVLQLVASGESNKAIARKLHIELGTVKSHMSAIMTKLGAASRTQAAGIAAARGLVQERMPARPAPLALRASPFELAA